MNADRNVRQATTGVPGLDEVLVGGFPANRIYLIQGDPGSGKTTLGLQFLLEGVRLGQRVMYVSLSETREEIVGVASSHGWSLDSVQLFEMSAAERKLSLDDDNTLFEPSEVELREIMQRLLTAIEAAKPVRLVFDSLSELRLLSQNPLRYRRQILVLKHFLAGRQSTVLFLDDRTSPEDDRQLQSLAHGVVLLEQRPAEYGGDRRHLRVLKVRGLKPRGGQHELVIVKGGLRVFPRLVAAEHREDFEAGLLSSGVGPLDELLGGGIDRGTATLIIGPAGSGKSSLAVRYALSAAERGERVAMFAFDERLQTLRARTRGLGLDLEGVVESGRLSIVQIDPAEMGPGEFVATVGRAVDEAKARVIIIDSLNGYLNAMPEERALALQLHELLSMLGHRGVTSFMVLAQHGILGAGMQSPVDVSYLADTVIMLRYFEAAGMVRKAVSVLKKRSGPHEHTIREYGMGPPQGITVGRPLAEFRGILTGVPNYVGPSGTLMDGESRRGESDDHKRPDSLAIAVFAPRGRDAALASDLLSHAGMQPIPCPRFDDLCREIDHGIGIVLVTEEELTAPRIAALVALLRGQPAWSDLPLVIFSSLEEELRRRAIGELQEAGNVSFVDRAVQKRSLLAAVRSALRARQRQYDARRAIEARDQFLAMLGHELRNPLSAIGFAMDLIRDRSLVDSRLAKYADTIKRQTGHLTRLVDDLLDVSRVTSGKVTLHRELTDLSSLVDRVVEAVRTMAERQGVSLTALPAPAPVCVDGDVVRLEQVVMNLVINAIKYTPRGGRIEVGVSLGEGGEAVLSVRDTGVGIPPEHLESIFDLFSQAPTGLDRAMGGLGLGLTLVRAIAAMHGGRVQAQSAGVGRGSEFRVRLPLAPAAAPSVAAETEAAAPQLETSGVRLVVVEDNTDVLEGLTELLADAGYSVEGAADGPQGLSRILAHRPIVALVDVGLPGFDGYELARRARTSLGDSIGLIAMTGYGQEVDRTRAFEAGFDDHVVKPSTIEEISAAIDRARLKRPGYPGSLGEAHA